MPPIVSIIGKSKSGKTTLIENLAGELKSRGYHVATIKHTHHQLTLDEPSKDSWRHLQAGSEVTVISSPNNTILLKPVIKEPTLDDIVHLIGEDYDIILTEGYKEGYAPKIEVHRKEVGSTLSGIRKLIAIVTDDPSTTNFRQFSFQEVKGLTDLLEKGFIEPQQNRLTIRINDMPVPLISFPNKIIGNVLLAIAASLKGVGEIRNLKIFLRRESK